MSLFLCLSNGVSGNCILPAQLGGLHGTTCRLCSVSSHARWQLSALPSCPAAPYTGTSGTSLVES